MEQMDSMTYLDLPTMLVLLAIACWFASSYQGKDGPSCFFFI